MRLAAMPGIPLGPSASEHPILMPVRQGDVEEQLEKLVAQHKAAGNALFAEQQARFLPRRSTARGRGAPSRPRWGAFPPAARRWEQATKQFTLALKFARGADKEAAAVLLSNRSAGLASWSMQLRSRPAALSESRALYAPDPTHLAQLALKDAEKAIQLRPTWHKGYSRQGAALFLLERYSGAETSYLEGLMLAPGNTTLAEGLAKVQAVLEEQQEAAGAADAAGGDGRSEPKRQRRVTRELDDTECIPQRRVTRELDDTECILCMKLLCEPVTTPCGHTFCRSCFARALDHSSKCPCCRTVLHVARELPVLHVARELPVSITLKSILSRAFPEEYAARVEEEAAAAAAAAAADGGGGGGGAAALPLFVMSTMLPGEKMALNIFEPRYRLMVRRCMEGSHLLGMAQVARDHSLDPVACEAAITECQQLPDGRYYLELTGRRRVAIDASWEQDGYRVANVRALKDAAPEAGSEEEAELRAVTAEVDALADTFMARLRSFYSGRRLTQLLSMLERVGDKPTGDPEALSWYIGRILLLFAPDGEGALRDALLASTSTLARLRDQKRLLQGRLDGGGACAVM
ncbi:MAG: PUA-like domain-containing protein [Monoraphidium minutum]|nr:MAG: PUA-like domain-containing protein [Monoraphidium minutum]